MSFKGTILFLLVCFYSCSSKTKTNWTKAEQDAFRENCVVNSKENLGEVRSRNYCDCMLRKVETKYPDASEAGKITRDETMAMAKDCMDETPPSDNESLIQ